MTSKSDELITHLEALEARATPGPWIVNQTEDYSRGFGTDIKSQPTGKSVCDTWYLEDPFSGHGKADAEFIATARNALPQLLAEIKRLNAEWEYQQELTNRWQSNCCKALNQLADQKLAIELAEATHCFFNRDRIDLKNPETLAVYLADESRFDKAWEEYAKANK